MTGATNKSGQKGIEYQYLHNPDHSDNQRTGVAWVEYPFYEQVPSAS
jgi:hypothetical protein